VTVPEDYTDHVSAACSVARTAAILGDPWSVLLVRDLRTGVHRFDDLAAHLGIARTVLTRRLTHLVEHGIVERVDYRDPGCRTRAGYRLTERGLDLGGVLGALMQFGDRHLDEGAGPPMIRRHHGCGARVHQIAVCEVGHRVDRDEDVDLEPGPGARRTSPRGEPT